MKSDVLDVMAIKQQPAVVVNDMDEVFAYVRQVVEIAEGNFRGCNRCKVSLDVDYILSSIIGYAKVEEFYDYKQIPTGNPYWSYDWMDFSSFHKLEIYITCSNDDCDADEMLWTTKLICELSK